MASSAKQTTVLSTKGQVILPKAIRDQRQWNAGTRLLVENTEDGILLRPAPAFPLSQPAEVFGCLPAKGKPKTLEEMKDGILNEAKRRYVRD